MDDRRWRAEQACAAAWPAVREARVGDWRVPVSGGPTRRINAASPARSDAVLRPGDLDAITTIYHDAGQPAIVRVPDFVVDADRVLDAAGFEAAEGVTRTLHATLGPIAGAARVVGQADAAWLDTRARLAPGTSLDGTMAVMTRRIAGPAAFVSREVEGVGAAVAYGAIAHGMLVIEAVATDPAYRRRGLARECVATLMAWAYDLGVREACLQVAADNAGAIALYRGLGFGAHLYDYHYRRREGAGEARWPNSA